MRVWVLAIAACSSPGPAPPASLQNATAPIHDTRRFTPPPAVDGPNGRFVSKPLTIGSLRFELHSENRTDDANRMLLVRVCRGDDDQSIVLSTEPDRWDAEIEVHGALVVVHAEPGKPGFDLTIATAREPSQVSVGECAKRLGGRGRTTRARNA